MLLAFAAVLFSAAVVSAQTTSFTYQGRLTDGGSPASGSYDLQFTLWDAATGGTQQPQGAPVIVTKPGVAVRNGAFSVQLDFGVSAFPGADRFLEISVRPAADGALTTLSPRQQISASPYSIHTISADALSSACVGCVQDSQINSVSASKLTGSIPASALPAGGSFIQNSTTTQASANFNIGGNGIIGGNVGIGTPNPATKLDVRGHLTLDPGSSPVLYTSSAASEQNRYLQLINSPSSPSASGLKAGGLLVADSYGYANPGKNDLIVKGNAGFGTPSPASRLHLAGSSTFLAPFTGLTIDQTIMPRAAPGGYTFSIRTTDRTGLQIFTRPDFLVDSAGNVGVGTASPSAKLHVSGGSAAFDGSVGIGTASPSELLHVFSAGSNAAALVQAPSGLAAQYQLKSGAANTWGVLTQDNFNNSELLFRYGSSDLMVIRPNYGVGIGTSLPISGLDVKVSGDAVRGVATILGAGVYGSGVDYGVFGYSRNGYAGYFDGKVRVTGNLEKPAGSFKIDHPLDPANKYLYHSFVESPGMMNIYNGNATLDARGEAVVRLPTWFGALNRDFRYQLTAVGAPGPNLYVAETVRDNRFKIAGGRPGLVVSWQVTGVRQDAYANAHRVPVEEDKPAQERGFYLHPEAFNQPAERSVERARDHEAARPAKEAASREKEERTQAKRSPQNDR